MTASLRIHAQSGSLLETVVRAEIAGKWFHITRIPTEQRDQKQLVGVREAARTAVRLEQNGGRIFAGAPGGRTFDQHVRRIRAANEAC